MVRQVLCACRSLKLAPLTVSNLMKNADKIKQSVQHVMTVSVMPVSYSRSKLLKKNGEIIVIMSG